MLNACTPLPNNTFCTNCVGVKVLLTVSCALPFTAIAKEMPMMRTTFSYIFFIIENLLNYLICKVTKRLWNDKIKWIGQIYIIRNSFNMPIIQFLKINRFFDRKGIFH